MQIREKYNKKLLVEGNDDQHVIWSLCEKHKVPETFDVIDCDGVDNLKDEIPVRLISANDTVGIIIDADTDMYSRWNSIKDILNLQHFTAPDELPKSGLILFNNSGKKKAGVWIMPDNNSNGMLEDFISFLIPPDDNLLPVVNTTLNDIENKKLNRYPLPLHKSKATIHTWLAWQEDPGTPMGLSITKRYLTTDEATCLKLVNWLKELFK
jgi:hypothetical protein